MVLIGMNILTQVAAQASDLWRKTWSMLARRREAMFGNPDSSSWQIMEAKVYSIQAGCVDRIFRAELWYEYHAEGEHWSGCGVRPSLHWLASGGQQDPGSVLPRQYRPLGHARRRPAGRQPACCLRTKCLSYDRRSWSRSADCHAALKWRLNWPRLINFFADTQTPRRSCTC